MNIRRFFMGLGLALLIILALIPLITSIVAEYIIDDQLALRGASNVSVDEIWINPYTGIVDIKDLKFSVAEAEYSLTLLQLTVSLEELLDRRVWVETIDIDGLDIKIRKNDAGELLVNGLDLSSQAKESKIVNQDIAGKNSAVVWNFALDFLTINDLRLDIELAEINVMAHLNSLVIRDIDTGVKKSATIEISLDINKVQLPDADLTAKLNVNYKIDLEFEGVLEGKPRINAKSILDISDAAIDSQGFSVVVPAAQFNLQGDLDYDGELAYQAILSANLKQLVVTHLATNKLIAQFTKLALDATLSPSDINIKNIAVNGLHAFTQLADITPDLLTNADINISQVAVALTPEQSLESIDVQEIELASAVIRLLVDKQGELPQIAMIESLLPANRVNDDVETTSAVTVTPVINQPVTTELIAITIHKIILQPDVIVYFDDKSVRPEFSEEIRVVRAEINNLVINNAQELTDIDLELGLSHDAAVVFNGQFNMLSQLADADLTIEKFQLLSVSGYAKDAVGYALESGRFSLDSVIKVADGQLHTNHNILIDRLSLREITADKAKKISQKMSMPLEKALDLLRDSDNRIKLTVPIAGPVNDPDVDIQQIINKALGSAMAKTSMLVLKSLLQPYGALITIAQYAGEKATKVRLEPIEFDDGVATLNTANIAYATKVAGLIKGRESLTVKLCGVTDSDDLAAIRTPDDLTIAEVGADASEEAMHNVLIDIYDSQLQLLANKRAKNLKTFFLQEQNVNPDQLVMCLSKHSKESIVGGVELSI
ncbi:MAG: hypothetical protein ACI90U_002483 [Pseudomonadales bacterium]|jgi:hypothetical protein